jgi:hypothetical protein
MLASAPGNRAFFSLAEHVLDTSGTPLLRQLDLLVLALALPVFLLAGLPILGYAVAAGAWLAQRALEFVLDRRIAGALESGERRAAMGMTAFSKLGRVWLLALVVLLAGLADREAGLTAAVLCALLFTIHLGSEVFSRVTSPEAS